MPTPTISNAEVHGPMVSVIIPTRNSASTLEACLRSVAGQVYKSIEIVVVDNSSSDNTKAIAQKYTSKVFNQGPERSAQRNFGVRQSGGEFVFIIDSDMELAPTVIGACVQQMQASSQFQALVVPEESFGIGFWAQCKKLERSFYVGVDWMEAARFFRKDVFTQLGGYNEAFTGWEDFDLPQRLESAHGSQAIGRIGEYIYHNEQTLSLRVLGQKRFYYARHGAKKYTSVETNRGKVEKQLSALRRYQLFFSKPGRLFRNPLLGIGMLFMKTWEFAGAAFGLAAGKIRPS